MSHPLHAHLASQLEEKLKRRRVVLFYDPRKEFTAFVEEELEEIGRAANDLERVAVSETLTTIVPYHGSLFGVRSLAEPVVQQDAPGPVLIYLPGAKRHNEGSVLLELELGGATYEPQLKRLARHVLRGFFTDGAIDEMLQPEALTYADVVALVGQAEGGGQASVLKTILPDLPSEMMLAIWLSSDVPDQQISQRAAADELYQLIRARLGLEIDPATSLVEARMRCRRYVLVNEFRDDLAADPPAVTSTVPSAPSKEHLDRVRSVAQSMRRDHGNLYPDTADQVEAELDLSEAEVDPLSLGAIDTFRFEERRLLSAAVDLVAKGQYDRALELVEGRSRSFWLDRDVARRAQWEACRLAAKLGQEAARVGASLAKPPATASAWMEAYTDAGGWFQLDRLQRRVEAWLGRMDEEPEAEPAVASLRSECDELLKTMALGFSAALAEAGWNLDGPEAQTHVYPGKVKGAAGKVAYFFVDALRYEMGVELAEHLEGAEELSLTPAVAALPTITPVGMAALLPGASSSFSVVESNGKLAAQIGETELTGWADRWKYLQARVPGVAELSLSAVVQRRPKDLSSIVDDCSLLIVRSQDIDFAGEQDNELARQVMDTVIGNLARAVQKLAKAGIESFVITADHGHLFSLRREEDMRTDNPAGNAVGLHRRCWVGRGGTTPAGCTRVSGAELGYDTDLDFVFPTGLGVFRSGGGLAYHHGGVSLQELVVPVLSFRLAAASEGRTAEKLAQLGDVPDAVTNRVVAVKVTVIGDVLSTKPMRLRVMLLSDGEQVGEGGMASSGDFDIGSGVLTAERGTEANVALMLSRDDCTSVQIVLQDADSRAIYDQTSTLPVKLGI